MVVLIPCMEKEMGMQMETFGPFKGVSGIFRF